MIMGKEEHIYKQYGRSIAKIVYKYSLICGPYKHGCIKSLT